MYKKGMFLIFITVGLFLPLSAFAKPQITIDMTSEKEIIEMVDGKEVTKLVSATEVEPGQILIFNLNYANNGDEKATNVVINNPIPKDTIYVIGSASEDKGELLFSIDSGQAFKKPSLLTYEIKSQDGKLIRKIASPEQYTDIRWIIPEILPGTSGKLSFQVKVN